MADQHDGFTIQVHGDVPQEALDGLVAAIPVRTIIIGAGTNAHAIAPTTADQVNQAFGAGSEMATMAHAALETPEERRARLQRWKDEPFTKAKKIPAAEYAGWVSWPDHGDDGFFESIDALRKHCTNHKLALPPFVWACTREPFKLDADHILDQALEEHHDGARGEVFAAEEERLQTLLDEWCAVQEIVSWNEDRTRAVMLSAADNVTDQICGLDRKALISALEWQAQEWVEEFMIHDMARLSDEPIKLCFAAIVDPEKLAAIIGEMLRGCGLEFPLLTIPDSRFMGAKQCIRVGKCGFGHVHIEVLMAQGGPVKYFTMPAARDLALRLLQLPEDATAEDASREVEKRS